MGNTGSDRESSDYGLAGPPQVRGERGRPESREQPQRFVTGWIPGFLFRSSVRINLLGFVIEGKSWVLLGFHDSEFLFGYLFRSDLSLIPRIPDQRVLLVSLSLYLWPRDCCRWEILVIGWILGFVADGKSSVLIIL
ncbi:hypothetical protein OPV22_024966 [Ensete ventricosum]|uniref:Uncharacterized protein n=1 Tax=Ensete ventricosum TaxID=4639 RepID=A0AAV8QBD4_ENSVE|nr:hypothetical protein OPV22_024966 [Ensete ventricosum]